MVEIDPSGIIQDLQGLIEKVVKDPEWTYGKTELMYWDAMIGGAPRLADKYSVKELTILDKAVTEERKKSDDLAELLLSMSSRVKQAILKKKNLGGKP